MIKERDIFGRIKSKYKNGDFIPLCEEYKINKNIYTLEFAHKDDIRQLKQFLYKNANFYLKRKYSKLT